MKVDVQTCSIGGKNLDGLSKLSLTILVMIASSPVVNTERSSGFIVEFLTCKLLFLVLMILELRSRLYLLTRISR